MCRCCLIGGMDIKNFLRIFSRHGFTVQEKAKANKAQTQKKDCCYSFMARAFTQRTKPRGPGGTEGPALPGSQPGILLRSSSSPERYLAQHSANFISSPTQMPFPHLLTLTWSRGHRAQTPGNFPKHPKNCRASQLWKNCWKHSQKPWLYHGGTQTFSGSQHQRL